MLQAHMLERMREVSCRHPDRIILIFRTRIAAAPVLAYRSSIEQPLQAHACR